MRRNRIGDCALLLSSLGLILICVFSAPPLGALLPWVSLVSPLGFALGIAGLVRHPRKSAAWATILGMLGSAYLPTIWLGIIRGP